MCYHFILVHLSLECFPYFTRLILQLNVNRINLIFVGRLLSNFVVQFLCVSDRSYLRITQQEFYALPLDIIIQGIFSLFVAMYGIMYIAGDFKEIRATTELENKSWETLRNLPSFYSFNHRGKAMFPYEEDFS